ncbi:MAG: thioesterase family protein [Myxococcota bacterium]
MPDPHIYRMHVRFRDTDAQGHVYFANYLVFCDEAWGAYMRHIGFPYQDLAKLGVDTYYVNAQCEYSGSALYEDEVKIETHVTRLGRTSITTEFTVRDDQGNTLAKASVTSVCVDPTTRETTPIPDQLRTRIQAFES